MHKREIEEHMGKGYLVLDVRSEWEYQQAHVTGAWNIPLQSLPSKISELGDQSRPILVHCAHGIRSAHAVAFLRVNEFSDVLDGGGIEFTEDRLD